MKCCTLVYIKIYGGNINVYTRCTLCVYYDFSKNNENYTFYKIIIFGQNRKYEQNVDVIILMKTMRATFKNIEYILVYIEIHGVKHCV